MDSRHLVRDSISRTVTSTAHLVRDYISRTVTWTADTL